MTDINELESRITAALDRIGSGLERMGGGVAGGIDPSEHAALREALEAERSANAQLEERVLAIKEKQEKLVARLEDEVQRLRGDVARSLQEQTALREVNTRLRENNAALRAANANGVGDASLINAGAEAELQALQLRQREDREELEAVINELRPLMEGAARA